MANLVSDVISEALQDLGVIRPGETVPTAVLTDCFMRLNQMWAAWGAEPDTTNAQYHQSLTLTAGTTNYTFGTGGTLVATAAPIKIYGAQSVSGSFRSPVKIGSFAAFDELVTDPMGTTTVLANLLAVDNSYPSANLKVYPVPAASPGSLVLDYVGAMTAFAATSSSLSLHPAFEEALHFNLAMVLLPRYGRQGINATALAANAQNSKARIVELNRSINGGPAAAPAPAQQ
jgi:hypothetical protein